MEDRKINEQESIQIISQMIKNTQERFEKNSGIPFVIWGYGTIVTALVVWYMVTSTLNYHWHWLWFMLPVISGIPYFIYNQKKTHYVHVRTYVDRIINYIWIVMGISSFFVSLLAMFRPIPILFIIILLMGMATTLTGLVCRYKPIVFCGILGIILSFLTFLFKGTDQILFFAGVFLVMMVIPGHILNAAANKHNRS